MLSPEFTPFPELSTERLLLQQLRKEHAPEFFRMRSDREVMRYIPRPLAKTEADVLALIESMDEGIRNNDMINWGMFLKSDGRLIGTMGFYRMSKEDFRAEIGYLMAREFHGKGFMQEAIEAALDYGFRILKLHSVSGVIDPGNAASEKLLLRNHFVKEAHFREDCYFDGRFLDSIHYGRINPYDTGTK